MAEGVAVGGTQVAAGVYNNPDSPPPPDPDRAPKGWTWRRGTGQWEPSRRMARGRGAVPDTSPTTTGPGHAEPGNHESVPGPAVVTPGPGTRDQDPAPGWGRRELGNDQGAAGAEPGPGDRTPFDEVPPKVKDDITGLIGLAAVPILSLLQTLDPYCGGVLADSLDPAVEAALPLICRSSRIVAYFADEGADWLLWARLATALRPVGQALAEHHLFRRVEITTDPKTGARGWQRVDKAAAGGPGDHLTPEPQPEYRYAA